MARKLRISSGDSGGSSPPSYWKEAPLAIIDVASEASLEKWGSVLGLERADLLAAIEDFGPVVRDIRRGLLLRSQDEAA